MANYVSPNWVDDSAPKLNAANLQALTDCAANNQLLHGSGTPDTSTAGAVGQQYMDDDTGVIYTCKSVSGGSYTWAYDPLPDMLAPEFDPTVAYASDTCVRHDGKLYRRKLANNIIAKAWNSADWVEITVGSGMQATVRRSTVYFGGGSAWSGTGDIKYATIAMASGTRTTENTKIDLQPTPEQIVQLQNDGVTALLIETIVERYEQQHYITIQRRACAIGGVPSEAMTIPCTLTEVQ